VNIKAKFVLPLVSALIFQVADLSAGAKTPGGGTACQNPVPINPVWNSCFTSQLSGCLDSTFNGTGFETTAISGNAEPVAVKQDSAGNLFVIGQVNYSNGTGAVAIVHYLANGALDQGFGSGGILVDQIAGSNSIFGTYDGGMDTTGNLLVVISLSNGYSVRRYSPAGVPDATFNSNALSAFSALKINRPNALRVQGDGKIVISGDYISSRKSAGGFVFRLNPDGTPDLTFGSNGLVLVTSLARARGAALQLIGANQYFVLGGTASNGFALVRLTPSGSIDTAFGTGGITTTSYCASAAIFGLAIDGVGNILAGGTTQLAVNGASKVLIARYTADGVLDTTFGDPSSSSRTRTGTTVLDTFGGVNQVTEIAPASDSAGHILLAGNGFSSAGKFLILARYNANGTLDSTFGGSVAATNFGNENNYVMQLPASNLTIQSNGDLVVTGGATLALGGSYVFGIARYWP
jgi:uncharacterized delta-60 repeat protein